MSNVLFFFSELILSDLQTCLRENSYEGLLYADDNVITQQTQGIDPMVI